LSASHISLSWHRRLRSARLAQEAEGASGRLIYFRPNSSDEPARSSAFEGNERRIVRRRAAVAGVAVQPQRGLLRFELGSLQGVTLLALVTTVTWGLISRRSGELGSSLLSGSVASGGAQTTGLGENGRKHETSASVIWWWNARISATPMAMIPRRSQTREGELP
jgi:hypothetical protein